MNKLDEALVDVGNLITFLHSRLGKPGDGYLIFQRKGLGSMHLDYEESSHYHTCLVNLTRAAIKKDDLSRRSVENALQEAILKVLNADNASGSVDVRMNASIKELRSKLSVRPTTYRCYIPVRGIMKEGLPISIGFIEFCNFDDSQSNQFREAISKHTVQKEFKLQMFEEYVEQGELHGTVCGIVRVEAKDAESAQLLVLKQLRLLLDILNFFSDIVPNHPRAWAYLPGDLEPHLFRAPILNDDTSFHLPRNHIGPLMELSIPRVVESDTKYRTGIGYVINLLSQKSIGKIKAALVTAIHWAGRAVIAKRREESFLLYAIALESIILADNPENELSYRLRIRIAHLLSTNLETRREIDHLVRNLYGLRSKIVHDGQYEITDLELESIRTIANRSLQRFCTDPDLQTIETKEQFTSWFQDKVLA